jgi:hypothetical protein
MAASVDYADAMNDLAGLYRHPLQPLSPLLNRDTAMRAGADREFPLGVLDPGQ